MQEHESEVKIQGGSTFCIECGDQAASVYCEICQDQYCDMCFKAQHRKGNRAKHVPKLLKEEKKVPEANIENDAGLKENKHGNQDMEQLTPDGKVGLHEQKEKPQAITDAHISSNLEKGLKAALNSGFFIEDPSPLWFERRSKFVPLRLNPLERALLDIVEGCMDVSEYTDNVDIMTWRNKDAIKVKGLRDVAAILSGLIVTHDFSKGKAMVVKSFKDNEALFQEIFEIARRHKIRNPDKMRTSYGKMIHLLMDAVDGDIREEMEFNFVKHVRTVFKLLSEKDGLSLLHDPLMPLATLEIYTHNKTRKEIDLAVKQKQIAIKRLVKKYARDKLTEDDIKLSLLSIGDNHNFLRSQRGPVDEMLHQLQTNFDPNRDDRHSLSISCGIGGSCLSHSHHTHFYFVLQSLMMWRDVLHNMFELWFMAEADLLDPYSYYNLRNTGQGLQRMQRCPHVSRGMSQIVGNCHTKVREMGEKSGGRWIGLSVVHLGDRDVPNALVFIDKYNQVARILTPIITVLREITRIYNQDEVVAETYPNSVGGEGKFEGKSENKKNSGVKHYVDQQFGGLRDLKMTILADFFKHGFDGSGDDGGSCIDGRLTSAWNWCSRISKKSYYYIFLMTGFIGFDGEF